MKPIVICLLFLNFSTPLFAQNLQRTIIKPSIDTSVFGRWPSAEMPSVSNDGNYALYTIRHQPADGSTLVIRSLKNEWEKKIINASNASFTADSKKVVFISPRTTLCSLDCGSDSIDSIAKTSSYKLIKQMNEEWLIYQLNDKEKELKAVNLKDNQQKSFNGVINYMFSADGNVLVVLKQSDTDSKSKTIDWIDFSSGNARNIWSDNNAGNFVFDKTVNQLAFVVETRDSSKDGKTRKAIFCYKKGHEKAELLADDHTKGLDSSLVINGISDGFSKDGDKLFINLKEKEHPKPRLGSVMVDIWSYQDVKLQSMQLAESSDAKLYKAAIQINDHHIVRLQEDGDNYTAIVEQWPSKVYVSHYSSDLYEGNWNAANRLSYYLVYTDKGERQKLKIKPEPFFAVSPKGKYIIGKIEDDRQNLYCYNTEIDKSYNITKSIPANFDKELDDKALSKSKSLEVGPWLENDEGVILFDRYDMWLVDPQGINVPVNLTNGYGKKNKIVFRMPEVYRYKSIKSDSKIFLKGFNRISKEEGLYVVKLREDGNPKVLTKGSYAYEIPNSIYNSTQLTFSSGQNFIIRRESFAQSPNFFLTSDFKTFIQVTDVYPEKSFNWLMTELHTWKGLNGESIQGILYKPQNFDPKRKYPVIFHYYEKMSDGLNRYLEPETITAHLNIPWFVSNGYLVFTPDIHYQIGKPGQSALNAVTSAAKYLQKFVWVDSMRMGLQGQSFGGYETNYIVTHSNLFAAAMSSAGFSDCISDYDGISHGGRSRQNLYESGQNRIGATLWERPDLYIQNSPIFHAYKVTTPVLLMNNKADGAVPFAQGVEFFTALRRLGKRAWMLQYDNGDHVLFTKEDALQHTIRMTQFFDHYLKGAPAPIWMTRGIPAFRKGIDDGLELDKEIKTPGKSLLKTEEKRKVETLKNRKPIIIKIE